MRRWTAITVMPLVAALLLPVGTVTAASGAPSAPVEGVSVDQARIFAEDSFWYRQLPSETPVDTNSSAIVRDLVRQAETHWGRPGYPNIAINTDHYTPTIYVADEDDPVVVVEFDNCQNKPANDLYVQRMFTGPNAPMKAVRIPAEAVQSAGTDREMIVIDPIEDRLVELWVTTKHADGSWSACWGVVQDDVSDNPGFFDHPFGVAASGISMLGGTILADELRRGEINHVIGMALPFSAPWPTVSEPANRTDGRNPQGMNVPAQGQLLRLPADFDVEALNAHPMVKAVARAARDYGIIIWDTAGAVSLRAENSAAFTNDPYPEIFDNNWSMVLMQQFPLGELEVLPVNYKAPVDAPVTTEPAPEPKPTPTPESGPAPTPGPEPSPAAVTIHRTNGWDGVIHRGISLTAAQPGDEVFLGDWNGDGIDTPAIRRGNKIMVWNNDGTGIPHHTFWYGAATDTALVGDWNGDGKDTVAIRRGNAMHVRNSLSSGNAESTVPFGRSGDEVLVGDWNGSDRDSLAIRRGNEFFISHELRPGDADVRFWYGSAADRPLVGDWNGDGKDTVAIRRGATVHVRNSLTTGDAERTATIGRPDDHVLVGDFNGNGQDTIALIR